jgi:hypothetical protein
MREKTKKLIMGAAILGAFGVTAYLDRPGDHNILDENAIKKIGSEGREIDEYRNFLKKNGILETDKNIKEAEKTVRGNGGFKVPKMVEDIFQETKEDKIYVK